MNLGLGTLKNAKEMAYSFNKFLLTVIVDTHSTDYSLVMELQSFWQSRWLQSLSHQVQFVLQTDEFLSSAFSCTFLNLVTLTPWPHNSPNVSNSSGSLRIIKFSAWFRHSSSDVTVLSDLRFFLVLGEDAGIGAAASAPSPEFSVTSSEASAGIT